MKIISLLVLLNVILIINCNLNNSTNLLNDPFLQFSSPSVLNDTEAPNFALLSPVEDKFIESNDTIFIIDTSSDESPENINRSFIFSTDISSPNTQIGSDLLKEENTTSLSSDSNISSVESETEDLNNQHEVLETTTLNPIRDESDFETTTFDTIRIRGFETTTLDTVSESSGLETTTLNGVSETSELETKPLDEKVEARDFEPKLEIRSPFKLFCGYGSWAAHRQGEGKFDVEDLNRVPFVLDRCTHIIYAFAGLNSSGNVMSLDAKRELDPNSGTFAKLLSIKERHPHIKTLIAIGGWDTPSDLFSFLVSNERMRESLTLSMTDFSKLHGFDGVVVSWFYPGSQWRGGHPSDKQNFATFIQELKTNLHFNGLELGVMAPASEEDIDSGFDVPLVSNSVDHLLLMTYDYHGSWEENVHHFAPLYGNNQSSTNLNINNTLNYWLNSGALRRNTVLGLATYGRSFTLADPSLNKGNSPSIGPGIAGPYTNRPGVIGFNEICEVFLASPGVKLGEDNHKVTPYIHLYDQWIGFEDELSLFLKTLYAMDNKLEGVFLWSIDLDDFQNKCGWGHFPLLKASIQAIYRDNNI